MVLVDKVTSVAFRAVAVLGTVSTILSAALELITASRSPNLTAETRSRFAPFIVISLSFFTCSGVTVNPEGITVVSGVPPSTATPDLASNFNMPSWASLGTVTLISVPAEFSVKLLPGMILPPPNSTISTKSRSLPVMVRTAPGLIVVGAKDVKVGNTTFSTSFEYTSIGISAPFERMIFPV